LKWEELRISIVIPLRNNLVQDQNKNGALNCLEFLAWRKMKILGIFYKYSIENSLSRYQK
jgi:hypothetical protein